MIRTPSRVHRHDRSRSGAFGSQRGVSGQHVNGLDKLLIGLRLLWCLAILYGELWAFTAAVHSCKWPTDFRYELTRTGSKPFKLLLIADPQILDLRSYPDKNFISKHLWIWFTDNYARKAWRTVVKQHKPDAVFFLGDLLDSGVEVTDRDEHSHYVHRFQTIFKPIPQTLPIYHIAGNHDLGLHRSPGGSAYARERFTETFGALNGAMDLGNHTLVWIDAPGLLEERTLAGDKFGTSGFQPAPGGVADFLQSFQHQSHNLPRILFSHIPLHRSEDTLCGPLRESRSNLHQGRGKNYQNELDQATSQYLLEAIAPLAVYSGDDHDYCEVTHHTAEASISEITCKTFSMSLGIERPAYQLVSLLNPQVQPAIKAPTQQSRLCLLPDQSAIYTRFYLVCLILSIIALLLPRIIQNLRLRRTTSAKSNGLPMHSSSRSRNILRRSQVKAAEEEAEEDQSAILSDNEQDDFSASYASGYPISSPQANYAYHTPMDDDYASIPTPFEVVPRQGKNRVRRVSRVWLWDPQPEDDYLKFLKQLGPVYRYAVRPFERRLRRVFHRLYGGRLQVMFARLNPGNVLGGTLYDMLQVAWVALLVHGLIWFWFTW